MIAQVFDSSNNECYVTACIIYEVLGIYVPTGFRMVFLIDSEKLSEDGELYLDRCVQILDFLHREALPYLQEAMKMYDSDLGIKTEGRRFLHILARMPQLQ